MGCPSRWSAPNWTEVEKMPAGRRACPPSQRPSREASARGIPEARASMTRSIDPVHNGRLRTTKLPARRSSGESGSHRTHRHPDRLASPMAPRSLPGRAFGWPCRRADIRNGLFPVPAPGRKVPPSVMSPWLEPARIESTTQVPRVTPALVLRLPRCLFARIGRPRPARSRPPHPSFR